MQDYKPASEKQIEFLKRLGYEGDIEGLTSDECSNLIKQLSGNKGQTNTSQQPQPKPLAQSNNNKGFEITTSLGTTITLSREAVDKYICANLSDVEYSYLSAVAKNYGLNPYLKEIYAIKYGTQPATFIIDYKVLEQAADKEPMYDGMDKGVLYLDKNGEKQEREGDYLLPEETLIGAWCIVYRKDRSHPSKKYALYSECVQMKDGKPNANWAKKPVFMNVKVAKTWALREAFPNWFSPNTYTSDEIDTSDEIKHSNIKDVIDIQAEKTGSKNLFDEDVVEDDNI